MAKRNQWLKFWIRIRYKPALKKIGPGRIRYTTNTEKSKMGNGSIYTSHYLYVDSFSTRLCSYQSYHLRVIDLGEVPPSRLSSVCHYSNGINEAIIVILDRQIASTIISLPLLFIYLINSILVTYSKKSLQHLSRASLVEIHMHHHCHTRMIVGRCHSLHRLCSQ